MKKLLFSLVNVFLFISLFSQTLLLKENFDYPVGTQLVGTNGWTEQGFSTTNILTISSGNLSYVKYIGSNIGNELPIANTGQDAYKAFLSQNNGTIYTSMLINISDATTTGDYFFAYQPSPGNTNYIGRLFIKKNTSNKIAFGISKGTESPVYSDFNYNFSTTYLLVLSYTFSPFSNNDDVISLYVNPIVGQPIPFQPTITTTGGITNDASTLGAILIRQGNASYAPTLIIDGIRVATTWEEAVKINNQAEILSFNIPNQVSSTINSTNATVSVVMPYGTDLTNLTPTIEISEDATISPASGIPQDFTNPVIYTVIAQDGFTTKIWTVYVSTQLNNQAEILSFDIPNQISSTINSSNATVNVVMPYGTDLTNLTPIITVSPGASISPQSGVPQNFSNPVIYTVTAQNGTTKIWTVYVSTQLNNQAEILSFDIPNQISSTINSSNATVNVVMPYGTDLTNLTPTITISPGASISPQSGVPQNFSNPVIYTVTAQNGTTKIWTVYVSTQLNNQAEILSFDIPNQISSTINSSNATVDVVMPYGTDLTNLTPAITISPGASISPQSGVPQNFSNPVIYTVTAQNGTTKIWTVYVSTQLNNQAEILAFYIPNQISSIINSSYATVDVVMPYGTDLTNLTPTITVSPGASISPQSGVPQNFSNPVIYTVTAQNGTTKIWTVFVSLEPPLYTTIVEWTFPNNPDDSIADGGIPANLNKIISSSASGTIAYSYAGATTNCARVTGWDNGANTKYWKVDFTTLGYKDISFSSKQRSSSTGPKHFKVQYMLNNNGNWIDLPGTSIITADNWSSGVIVDYMLPTQCNNQNLVSLRWIMTSDTAVNGSPVAPTGASRIDDIIVKGLNFENNEAEILSFDIPNQISSTINSSNATVNVVMPYGTDLTNLIPYYHCFSWCIHMLLKAVYLKIFLTLLSTL